MDQTNEYDARRCAIVCFITATLTASPFASIPLCFDEVASAKTKLDQ